MYIDGSSVDALYDAAQELVRVLTEIMLAHPDSIPFEDSKRLAEVTESLISALEEF